MTTKPIRLSKSRYTLGVQCPKALYLEVHTPELKEEITPALQAIFDQGHEVGEYAQRHFPGGVLIDAPYDQPELGVRQTQDAIARGALTIYEATFVHDDVLVRVDILHRNSTSEPWSLFEVKSTASVKPYHRDDVAIQYYVVRGAGIEVASAHLMHINSDCVYPDLSNLFKAVDLTSDAQEDLPTTKEKVSQLRSTLEKESPPKLNIGPHCSDPHECRFKTRCWEQKNIPTPSVFDLPNLGAKAWPLFEKGIIALDHPELRKLTGAAGRMIEVHHTKQRYVDKKAIKEGLADWQWPLSFLDFESIGPAIPRFEGVSPFDQVPFQFSLAIWNDATASIMYSDCLAIDTPDPRRAIAEALATQVPKIGSIVAYNKAFEGRCLKLLASQFPDLAPALLDQAARLVDPLPIIRAAVYDEAFVGSFSIKDVAPALCGSHLRYEGLSVADGQAAQRAYTEAADPETSPPRRTELRDSLLAYCKRDVEVMVELVKWMMAL